MINVVTKSLLLIITIILGLIIIINNWDHSTTVAATTPNHIIEGQDSSQQRPLPSADYGKMDRKGRSSFDDSDEYQLPKGQEISSPPHESYGVYRTAGYTVQPYSKTTYSGNSVTFYIKRVAPTLSFKSSFKTNWLMSSNHGISWSRINPKNENYEIDRDGNLTVKNGSVGKEWFQCRTVVWFSSILHPIGKSVTINSEVVTLTIVEKPIPAKKVTVHSDDRYLLNNYEGSSTVLHPELDPKNSTAQLVGWYLTKPSVKKEYFNNELQNIITGNMADSMRTNFATIDKETGEITSIYHRDGFEISENVRAWAIYQNKKSSDKQNEPEYISGSTVKNSDISIGGGLDDLTIMEGKKATFRIKGIDENKNSIEPEQVEWFEYLTKENRSVPVIGGKGTWSSKKVLSLNENQQHDGNFYFAKLRLPPDESRGKAKDEASVVATRKAKLTIINRPEYKINSLIYDYPWSNDSDNQHTQINNVVSGDEITITSSFQKLNTSTNAKSSQISFEVPFFDGIYNDDNHPGPKLDGVKISYYSSNQINNSNQTKVAFDLRNMSPDSSSHTITFTYKTKQPSLGSSKMWKKIRPYIEGTVEYPQSTNSFKSANNSNDLTINYATGDFSIFAHPISFDAANYPYNGLELKGRAVDRVNKDIVTVRDNRRLKKNDPVKFRLSFNGWKDVNSDADANSKLNASLFYHDKDGKSRNLPAIIPISSSFNWEGTDGIYLKFLGKHHEPGRYHTSLTWTNVSSI